MKTKRNNYLYTTKLGETQCVDVKTVVVTSVKIVGVVADSLSWKTQHMYY